MTEATQAAPGVRSHKWHSVNSEPAGVDDSKPCTHNPIELEDVYRSELPTAQSVCSADTRKNESTPWVARWRELAQADSYRPLTDPKLRNHVLSGEAAAVLEAARRIATGNSAHVGKVVSECLGHQNERNRNPRWLRRT